ncbi:MAG: hypothetical protein JO113_09385 [Candidatus Eremiobacteraeota bacterium]|nr:hypothetical protein [Candidatus Eremiobacteraeota bacterium]
MKSKAFVKGAMLSGAAALLLGASLALSSAGVVSGANAAPADRQSQPLVTPTCNTKGYCLSKRNAGSGGAIMGKAGSGNGLYGLSTSGTGVYGTSASAFGVLGISSSSDGVSGVATGAGNGVSGNSATGNGLYGDSSSGDGVYAQSSYSNGVYGSSSSSDGVYGNSSSSDGVYGNSSSSDGVYGQSTYGTGVHGYSQNGYAGDFESNASTGSATVLYAQGDAASDYLFVTHNQANDKGSFIDGTGDGVFGGYVLAYGGFKTLVGSRDGRGLGGSVAITAQATMEDTGTGRLFNGEGAVRFDRAFASTIDPGRGYQVFLTPNGDTRGLYVAAKYEGGFIVRENEHGRSSVYFDYRIIAHPYGASDARLPQLSIKPPPIPHLPPRHP